MPVFFVFRWLSWPSLFVQDVRSCRRRKASLDWTSSVQAASTVARRWVVIADPRRNIPARMVAGRAGGRGLVLHLGESLVHGPKSLAASQVPKATVEK